MNDRILFVHCPVMETIKERQNQYNETDKHSLPTMPDRQGGNHVCQFAGEGRAACTGEPLEPAVKPPQPGPSRQVTPTPSRGGGSSPHTCVSRPGRIGQGVSMTNLLKTRVQPGGLRGALHQGDAHPHHIGGGHSNGKCQGVGHIVAVRLEETLGQGTRGDCHLNTYCQNRGKSQQLPRRLAPRGSRFQ